jgi:hypothetical protein
MKGKGALKSYSKDKKVALKESNIMKKSELTEIIKKEINKILSEGFQGDESEGDGLSGFRGAGQISKGDGMSGFRGNIKFDDESEEDKVWRKNREDILKYGLEGARDWKRGIDINYGPYKDQDSFEYMYWKKGWEEADLAAAKRKNK